MKKLLLLILTISRLSIFSQSTNLNAWNKNGNTIGNNTSFIGPIDNRSLQFWTNNIFRGEIDSLGTLYHGSKAICTNTNSLVFARVGDSNGYSDFGKLGGGYSAIWMGASNVRTTSNFAYAGDGSSVIFVNAPNDSALVLIGNTNNFTTGVFHGKQSNTTASGIELQAQNRQTITAGANSPSIKFSLGTSGFKTGAITTLYGLQLVAPTWSAQGASVISTGITFFSPNPTAGASITVTNPYGIATSGNIGATGKLEVGSFGSSGTLATTLAVTGNGAFSTKLRIGSLTVPSANLDVTGTASISGTFTGASSILSNGITGGIGYAAGSGSTVTQATSRTTGVTINAINGAITLVSAAGLATYQTFVVTNSAVVATDVIDICQKSGTDLNIILVTNVAAGSFKISFATTGGITTEQPVFNFAVIKAVSN